MVAREAAVHQVQKQITVWPATTTKISFRRAELKSETIQTNSLINNDTFYEKQIRQTLRNKNN